MILVNENAQDDSNAVAESECTRERRATPMQTRVALATHGPLWRKMLGFLIPLIASNLLQSLSGTIGAVYYGQMIGMSALARLAAVAAFFPLFFFMQSVLYGISGAGAILVGQAYGMGDRQRVKVVAGTTLTMCTFSGLTITILCALFARNILVAIGTPSDITGTTLAYGQRMFALMPILIVFIVYTSLLRGVGDTRSSLIALGISTSISAVLVPAFIRGWSGLPQLGIVSGPYAAALAYAVSLSWLFVWLLRTRSSLAPDRELLRQLAIDGAVLKRLLQLGAAGGTYYVFLSLSEIAVIGFVNRFGSEATAAYGAFVQIVAYVVLPVVSIGITAAIFTAKAIGAGHATELSRVARTAIGLSLGMEGCLVVIVDHFHREIVGWFITAPATAQMATHLLAITLWSYPILGIVHALAGTMRGSGAVLWPTIFSLTVIWVIWGVEVPVAYLLSYRIGLDGIWVAFPSPL